jgi:hypothetical protein
MQEGILNNNQHKYVGIVQTYAKSDSWTAQQ